MTTGLRGLERLPKESGSHKIVGRDSWRPLSNTLDVRYPIAEINKAVLL